MKTVLGGLIGGLLLGGIIHIAIVFLVPLYATNDAWSRIQDFNAHLKFHVLPQSAPDSEVLTLLDPRLMHAVCRFDLESGPVRINVTFPRTFWSAAVFDRRGRNVYNLNDGSAGGSALDLALITPIQMALLRQNPPASLETAIIVERAMKEGFVLLRAFVGDDSAADGISAALSRASCQQRL